MTLNQLRYLVSIDAHRHFGRAAEACFVSQPTLSAQVRKLEAELGVEVFDRSFSPVRPTALGARVLAQARRVLAEADRIPALLAEASEVVAGELRLGVIPTLAPYLLPLLVPALKARHPALELVVSEWTTERIVEALEADALDAGLIATDEERRGLVLEPLFEEAFVVYLGRGHALEEAETVAPADLDPADLWLLAEGHCFRDQALGVCEQAGRHAERTARFAVGSLETLRLLVDSVGGVTLLPLLAVPHLGPEARRQVRRFSAPVPSRGVRLVSRRGGVRRALVEAVAGVLAETVPPVLA